MNLQQSTIAGGIYGLLIGDALGVPYEFNPPERLPHRDDIEMVPPQDFARAHADVPPGTWSDDGAQALALLVSLLDCEGLDIHDFGRRLVNWYENGYMAADGIVFDVGIQTADAIRGMLGGIPADRAGSDDEYANGNGSLMRVLPLALWHRGTDEELVHDARRQSIVTHAHLRSQLCCALYCLWARRVMQGVSDPWGDAVTTLREMFDESTPERGELEFSIRPDDDSPGKGSGYVVDALRSARWAVGQGNYEEVVKAAISLGNDTDTTACIAGGIAGLRDGIDGIPSRWLEQLRGGELVEPLIDGLMHRQGLDY
jgi:ADP-ribosyl-[dinitrogen reductase] hydrolase